MEFGGSPFEVGESIAVGGVCLTLVGFAEGLAFDVSDETLGRTTCGGLRSGVVVNLERALRAGDRMGGHFVQGHVDCIGTVVWARDLDGSRRVRFRVPEGGRLLASKGSVTVDGVSLTVIEPSGEEFEVELVPFTLGATTLGSLGAGDPVNIEFDMIAKHVVAIMGQAG